MVSLFVEESIHGEGELPLSIGNLNQLKYLNISYNNLQGSIPHQLGFIKNLTTLDLSHNFFNESFPISITGIELTLLHLSWNSLDGELPSSLGNLKQLEYLDISNNNIGGSIPFELGFLKNLTTLDLSHNKLNRILPISLTNLTHLVYLDISDNFLTVSLPSNFDQLTKLQVLLLNNNSIDGTFSISLTNFSQLENLDISHNLLLGTLPSKMFPLTYYKTSIDLSHNFFSGKILSQLGHFQQLLLNNNNLTGMVPQSLCNVSYVDISYNCLNSLISYCTNMNTCNKDVCLNISFYQFEPLSPRKNNNKFRQSVFILWKYNGKVAHDDIIRAKEDFDMRYCIGTCAYGSVYKAQLPCGKVVALKKLHGYEVEVPSFNESFKNEVRILSEIKHRHIVKLYGFCLHKRIIFLIYQYMEKVACSLSWVAFGLSYLHHDCTPPIVHRDISSSNILLNSEWQAIVSDFGATRLLQYRTNYMPLYKLSF
ncbi:putative protein kinase RLK-Pelle-DLSV family [Medicago truncatula]|uniref:non-specific serine/threonine protein kinase n=1 Tax=Medicago truncatula TaxID=3880 RepID=A0A396GSQ4_MEDTR|nr:putative protein kinase RLK-Pelle-DLSV family [Medicago truncatula]